MKNYTGRNAVAFGLGAIGRGMAHTMASMFLVFYVSEALKAPAASLCWVAGIALCARVFGALGDPVVGLAVDNTRTRFGSFKPWLAFGAFSSGIMAMLLFSGIDFSQRVNMLLFGAIYVLWGMCCTANDISYWSMLPALSFDQRERERIGAAARVCANIGIFVAVAGILPFTGKLGGIFGGLQKGYLAFAAIATITMWAGQAVTLLGVKGAAGAADPNGHTSIKELAGVIVKNDQLLFTALSMALFMVGYMTTASFAAYYFKYSFGGGTYAIPALILAAPQIAALAVFPLLRGRYERQALFTAAMIMIVAGYALFFAAPLGNAVAVGSAAALIFAGGAFVQLLMLMFLADSVDYGHWKLGRRNGGITFSLQTFINKMGGAASGGVLSVALIVSGMNAGGASIGGVFLMKTAMLAFPLACVLGGYFIYRSKYKIDRKLYDYIAWELEQRGCGKC